VGSGRGGRGSRRRGKERRREEDEGGGGITTIKQHSIFPISFHLIIDDYYDFS
jgi:hypothetical protein